MSTDLAAEHLSLCTDCGGNQNHLLSMYSNFSIQCCSNWRTIVHDIDKVIVRNVLQMLMNKKLFMVIFLRIYCGYCGKNGYMNFYQEQLNLTIWCCGLMTNWYGHSQSHASYHYNTHGVMCWWTKMLIFLPDCECFNTVLWMSYMKIESTFIFILMGHVFFANIGSNKYRIFRASIFPHTDNHIPSVL